MPVNRNTDPYGGRFASDPTGGSVLAGYQQATDKLDRDLVKRNIKPYKKYGFEQSISELAGMTDQARYAMATKAVLAKNKVGVKKKTTTPKKTAPKKTAPKKTAPRGSAPRGSSPKRTRKPRIETFVPKAPKPKYQPPPPRTGPRKPPRQVQRKPPRQVLHLPPRQTVRKPPIVPPSSARKE